MPCFSKKSKFGKRFGGSSKNPYYKGIFALLQRQKRAPPLPTPPCHRNNSPTNYFAAISIQSFMVRPMPRDEVDGRLATAP